MRLFVLCFAVLPGLLAIGGCGRTEPESDGEFILDLVALPDYEAHLDHAGLISGLSEEFYHRGTAIYRTACFGCHGNPDQPGTLPDSRRFWDEPFKHGTEPHALYATLTRGRGLMPPQMQLTPREKYQVIHFIREEFLKERNPAAYFEITNDYLASLPVGDTLGPRPTRRTPWKEMDYGPFLMRTYEVAHLTDGEKGISRRGSPLPNEDFRDRNFAYKGIAMRLDEGAGGVAAGQAFALFDHDLMRLAAFWTGEGFIDWEDILLDDQHNVFPRITGDLLVENPIMPGWANPETGDFADPRFSAVDGRQFGPLPRTWTHYKGLYQHGARAVVHYTVGEATVLESYALDAPAVLARTLNVSGVTVPLVMRAAPDTANVALVPGSTGVTLVQEGGYHVLRVTANSRLKLLYAAASTADLARMAAAPVDDLSRFTHGGPSRFPEVQHAPILPGDGTGYIADVLTLPLDNPWNSRLRPTGIDFLSDGDEAVVSTIDGEVWRLSGITRKRGDVEWRRIATGLFQPLGIKVHDGNIYVGCRNQIAVLRDLNGDGETDYYESFNNDHQVTEHFHEFAMGLQTDSQGNLYYAKSARHARTALIPQHGTLIRVSSDGLKSEIIANGFRAANGVLLNPDGTFIVTDQEGHWNPMNRINYVSEGGFYGNMYGYGAPPDSSDEAMSQPLVWIDKEYDRSPAELLWATSNRWGPLSGHLLNFSYGYGRIFLVMPQEVGAVRQAGIVQLPLPDFPTGIMRGRFNPKDGQLYMLGMSAWATSQMIQTGGLYRIRYAGGPVRMPVGLRALTDGVEFTFAAELDRSAAEQAKNFTVNVWDLERSRRYGSRRHNERQLQVTRATLDGRTVKLTVPDIAPTWIMEIIYALQDADGIPFEGAIQSTVYALE